MNVTWHATTVRRLTALLQPDPGVLALAVFGSACGAVPDTWSDLDLLVVVAAEARGRFFPARDWLAPLGEIYAVEQNASAFTGVTRVCFADMRRLDVIITTEVALEQIAEWPSVAFWNPQTRAVIFSRSATTDRVLAGELSAPTPRLPAPDDFRAMSDGFWYKGVLAVARATRGDRLIAAHLALEMAQDCLVLEMLLRDRATGTSHHPTGHAEDRGLDGLGTAEIPRTRAEILSLLEQAARWFDTLAAEWQPGHPGRRQPLLDLIAAARRELV